MRFRLFFNIKTISLTLLIALLGAGFIPYQTTVVPAVKIKVIDESGAPVPYTRVKQLWRNVGLQYDTDFFRHFELTKTDDNGIVTFPRRVITASFLHRLSTHMYILLHEGFFPGSLDNSSITAYGQDTDNPYVWGEVDYHAGGVVPEEIGIKLQKEPNSP